MAGTPLVEEMKKHMSRIQTDYKGHPWSYDNIFINQNLAAKAARSSAYSIGGGGSDHPIIKADLIL